jgi:Mg-chelatase subunit ChlD
MKCLIKFLFPLLFFVPFIVKAQLKIESTSLEIPIITRTSTRYVDFKFCVDAGKKAEEVSFLRAGNDQETSIKFSQPTIKVGECGFVRVQYNPNSTGKYRKTVDIYVSSLNKPIKLEIYGKVEQIPEELDLDCPNFNTPQKLKTPTSDLKILVVDQLNNQPIPNAKVEIVNLESGNNKTNSTNKSGLITQNTDIGRHSIKVSAQGYGGAELYQYIARNQGILTIPITKLTPPVASSLDSNKTANTPNDSRNSIKDTAKKSPNQVVSALDEFGNRLNRIVARLEGNHSDTAVKSNPRNQNPAPITSVDKPGELSHSEFKPNNILFLIDISASMAEKDKLPLLKESMKRLLFSLRDIDKITVITYADKVDILIDGQSAGKKDKIDKIIDKLQANGSTQGKKAIELAYKTLEANYIEGGNNQIYLATDGDFKLGKSENEMFDFVKTKANNHQTLSVIGFGFRERPLKKMENLAKAGSGSFLHIKEDSDYENIILEEVKMQSKK